MKSTTSFTGEPNGEPNTGTEKQSNEREKQGENQERPENQKTTKPQNQSAG